VNTLKKLAFVTIVAGSVGLIGCGGTDAGTDGGFQDAGTDGGADGGSSSGFDFGNCVHLTGSWTVTECDSGKYCETVTQTWVAENGKVKPENMVDYFTTTLNKQTCSLVTKYYYSATAASVTDIWTLDLNKTPITGTKYWKGCNNYTGCQEETFTMSMVKK